MRTRTFWIFLGLLVAINVLAQWVFFRWDLTADKRYTLSVPAQQLMRSLDAPVEVRLLLDGNMNASFLRLQNATKELLDELNVYAEVRSHTAVPQEGESGIVSQLPPTVIHERQQGGQTVQTRLYPYAIVRYKGRETFVPLLRNNRNQSGEENVNESIAQLEFSFAEAISSLSQTDVKRVAFIEGHGELSEPFVQEITRALSAYFQVDRGSFTGCPADLYPYSALIIAAPQTGFSDADKFQLDQYVMHGGRVLWVLDGVRFSEDILSQSGFTPVMALDLNLQDLLFRYGVRLSPTLLQDMQCLPIPVDVSEDPATPNWQPMPWYYAPLLLSSQASPITRNLMQVSSTFASALEFVGEEDGLQKTVLLATSSASRAIVAPAEVDLSLIEADPSLFRHQYIPVAASIEGVFPSLFAHRMQPEGIRSNEPIAKQSVPTRQVVVASGSIIRNDIQQGQPLPLGYDRYTGMQFANRDFLVNSVLYLADNEGLITLRNREVKMRLLNDQRAHQYRLRIQILTIVLPLVLLAIVGGLFVLLRRKKYSHI